MPNKDHVHDFKPIEKSVLLAKYRPENGKMKYQTTSGKDILKQFKCECGKVITQDLKRVKA